MSDALDPIGQATADEIAAVDELLARADVDGALWADTPAGLEDLIVDAIASEQNLPVPSGRRRPAVQWWLAAAATVLAVVAGITILVRGDNESTAFALEGTDRMPAASAEVWVYPTPVGLKILLEPQGLPPAPEGAYYEVWVSDGNLRVSAGTFHLRGGNGEIELWAGVADPAFNRLAVTLEPLDDDLDSSGDAYLRGTFELGG